MPNPFQTATPAARISFVMSIVAQMPDAEMLTLIDHIAQRFSCFHGADDILSGVDAVRDELAEDDADSFDFDSDARAYRAMQAGSGA